MEQHLECCATEGVHNSRAEPNSQPFSGGGGGSGALAQAACCRKWCRSNGDGKGTRCMLKRRLPEDLTEQPGPPAQLP